jgi:hypothetical protein
MSAFGVKANMNCTVKCPLRFPPLRALPGGAKHEWRDGEQSLEAQLPDIVSLMLLAGPILKERVRFTPRKLTLRALVGMSAKCQ